MKSPAMTWIAASLVAIAGSVSPQGQSVSDALKSGFDNPPRQCTSAGMVALDEREHH